MGQVWQKLKKIKVYKYWAEETKGFCLNLYIISFLIIALFYAESFPITLILPCMQICHTRISCEEEVKEILTETRWVELHSTSG